MADLAERPTSTALRSLGELALAAADRYSGDAMRAPGRPAITYADFGLAIKEIAGGLASLGVATGHLVNGTFSLPAPLKAAGAPLPTAVKTWAAPTSNEAVPITFTQAIGAADALRTGTYAKTLTFTLSTTTP